MIENISDYERMYRLSGEDILFPGDWKIELDGKGDIHISVSDEYELILDDKSVRHIRAIIEDREKMVSND